jgi:hypothetical protein
MIGRLLKLFGLRAGQFEGYVHASNVQPGAPSNKPLQPTSDAAGRS